MDRLGMLVRVNRLQKGETIKQLAKALKCSESFATHIESARSVPVSPRIIRELRIRYKIPATVIEKAAECRNKVGRAYYKKYRKAA